MSSIKNLKNRIDIETTSFLLLCKPNFIKELFRNEYEKQWEQSHKDGPSMSEYLENALHLFEKYTSWITPSNKLYFIKVCIAGKITKTQVFVPTYFEKKRQEAEKTVTHLIKTN